MAVSFQIQIGQTLEQVTVGAAAPTGGAGFVELRIDQTAGSVTDGNVPGGTRIIKRSEVQALMRVIEEALIRDLTNAMID